MLPGFRFLFAATLLTLSVLIFGLGAAALLRASHEQFAHSPVRRALPEPVFAQQPVFPQPTEPPAATLAMLRVIEPAVEKAPENSPISASPAPTEPAPDAIPVPPVETERLAALRMDEPAPVETVKSEPASKPDIAVVPEPAPSVEAAPLETPAEPIKLAAVPQDVPPAPVERAPAPPVDLIVPPAPESMGAPARIAALGTPAAAVADPASAKPKNAEADKAAARKRLRAQRAKERRRLAAIRAARQARQAAVQQQTATDPFGAQPTITTATTARRR